MILLLYCISSLEEFGQEYELFDQEYQISTQEYQILIYLSKNIKNCTTISAIRIPYKKEYQ